MSLSGESGSDLKTAASASLVFAKVNFREQNDALHFCGLLANFNTVEFYH